MSYVPNFILFTIKERREGGASIQTKRVSNVNESQALVFTKSRYDTN